MKKKRREENGSGLKEKRSAGGAGKGRGTAAPGGLDRGTIHGNRCVRTAVGGWYTQSGDCAGGSAGRAQQWLSAAEQAQGIKAGSRRSVQNYQSSLTGSKT